MFQLEHVFTCPSSPRPDLSEMCSGIQPARILCAKDVLADAAPHSVGIASALQIVGSVSASGKSQPRVRMKPTARTVSRSGKVVASHCREVLKK